MHTAYNGHVLSQQIHKWSTSTGYPVVNDPLYNHPVFGPLRGKGGDTGGKSDEQLVRDLIAIHNAENWLGVDAADDDLLFSKPVSDDKGKHQVDILPVNET